MEKRRLAYLAEKAGRTSTFDTALSFAISDASLWLKGDQSLRSVVRQPGDLAPGFGQYHASTMCSHICTTFMTVVDDIVCMTSSYHTDSNVPYLHEKWTNPGQSGCGWKSHVFHQGKLFRSLVRGEFSVIWTPSQIRKVNHDFLDILRNFATQIDGLASGELITALTFIICSYLLQVVIVFPDLEVRISELLSLTTGHIEGSDWNPFVFDAQNPRSLAVKSLLSQVIILYDLAEARSSSSLLVRLAKNLVGLDPAHRCIEDFILAAGRFEQAFSTDRPRPPAIITVPQRQYDHTVINHTKSAVLGDIYNNHTTHIWAGNQSQVPSENSSDSIGQLLQNYGRFNLDGLNQNMTKTVRSQNIAADRGGQANHEIQKTLDFPQFELAEGACTWILRSKAWRSWYQRHRRELLLITGSLGCGKSVVAKTLLKHVSDNASGPVLHVHLSSIRSAQPQADRAFYISLLSQLFNICDTVRSTETQRLVQYYAPMRCNISNWTSKALLTVIDKLLVACRPSFLVIDGIDDCSTDTERAEITKFVFLRRKSLSFIVTTRETSRFEGKYAAKIVLRKDSADREIAKGITQDLLQLINHRIDEIPIWQMNRNQKLRKKVKKFIFKQSQGNFLHARILLDTMSDCSIQDDVENFMKSTVLNPELKQRYNELDTTVQNSMKGQQRLRRAQIIQILTVAAAPLSLRQLEEFLCINPSNGELNMGQLSLDFRTDVQNFGRGFLEISEHDEVQFYHSAAKDYFREIIAMESANLYLADKCLAILQKARYQQPETASDLLMRHICKDGLSNQSSCSKAADQSPVYEYAVIHFHEHLVAVNEPPEDLVRKSSLFLHGIEFVTWSESLVDIVPDAARTRIITVYRALLDWSQRLNLDGKNLLGINDFFKVPHVLLADALMNDKNQALQYLPRIRIAEYFNAGGQCLTDLEISHEERNKVVDGLSEVLNSEHPLVLANRASLYSDYLWMKKFKKARDELRQLHEIQQRVLDPESSEIFMTTWYLAGAYIALGDDASAQPLLAEAIEHVQQQFGKKYRLFLLLFLLEGQRLEIRGDLPKAAACYRLVFEVNDKLAGPESGLTIMARIALGAISRKEKDYEQSYRHLFAGFGFRERTISINLNVTFDAGLQLAMLYRDKQKHSECLELLDNIRGSMVFEEDFERKCQLIHIQTLVQFDKGDYEKPRDTLRALIDQTNENRAMNNRELLWMRLDLSDVMRSHGDDKDALMLFTDLVRTKGEADKDVDDYAQPESAEQLRAAEKALRFVREARLKDAQEELNRLNLEWVRKEDFYILIQGGPTLDTSIIRPITNVERA